MTTLTQAARRGARTFRYLRGLLALSATRDRSEPLVEVPRTACDALVRGLAAGCETVLDVGTGLMDSLENLPCKVELLRQAEAIARRRTVVFTPRGDFPQQNHDAFGLGGEGFQQHRSARDVRDRTSLGYRVAVLKALHDSHNESFVRAFGASAPPVEGLLAWKRLDSGRG